MPTGERSKASIERVLERFIVDELLDEGYAGGDPLAGGAVDSLGLEQLAEYIDQRFGVKLADADMVEENFESVAAVAALVESRMRGGER